MAAAHMIASVITLPVSVAEQWWADSRAADIFMPSFPSLLPVSHWTDATFVLLPLAPIDLSWICELSGSLEMRLNRLT